MAKVKVAALSPDAQALFSAHAGKTLTWGDAKEALDTPDINRIALAWNELKAAKLTRGQLSTGELCEILTEPKE